MYAVQPAMAEENKIGYIDAQRVLDESTKENRSKTN